MVARSEERMPAISTAREKRSHGCVNFAMRPRIPSSTISRAILTCRRKQLRLGLRQAKATRTKRSRCCAGPQMPKTFWASIPFRPAHLFRFGNNSAVCCLKSAKRKKHSKNSKLHSRSIRGDSEDCMERRELPSKVATRKLLAATTRSWLHKLQALTAHEMN